MLLSILVKIKDKINNMMGFQIFISENHLFLLSLKAKKGNLKSKINV